MLEDEQIISILQSGNLVTLRKHISPQQYALLWHSAHRHLRKSFPALIQPIHSTGYDLMLSTTSAASVMDIYWIMTAMIQLGVLLEPITIAVLSVVFLSSVAFFKYTHANKETTSLSNQEFFYLATMKKLACDSVAATKPKSIAPNIPALVGINSLFLSLAKERKPSRVESVTLGATTTLTLASLLVLGLPIILPILGLSLPAILGGALGVGICFFVAASAGLYVESRHYNYTKNNYRIEKARGKATEALTQSCLEFSNGLTSQQQLRLFNPAPQLPAQPLASPELVLN